MMFRISAIGLSMLVFAAAHGQSNIDRSFTVTSKNCEGVQWEPEALATHPHLPSACQAVEERDGKSYVKFAGTVVKNTDRGKEVQVRIKGGDTLTFNPPSNMTVYIDDRKTPVSALARGDELNFYVPEDRFAAQFAQDTSPTPQYVVVPIVYREVVEYDERPEQTAQAMLPATANNHGVLVLLGAGMLAFAIVLTVRRGRKQYW